jgi:UDP-N-acetylmuramoyl-tripeptide--D-alanyl-D-alanine ligase
MTLLELRQDHEVAIIEVGIDEIGAMQQHMSLISPNTAVITAIGPEHLEKLRDVPTVAREEGAALSHVAKSGGNVVINLDDPWIRPHLMTLKEGRKVPFSLHGATAPMDMISGELSPNGRQLTFQGLGIQSTTLSLPLLGTHNASNLLAAVAIAASLGLTADEIKSGLSYFIGAEGRSQIQELPGPTYVVCDYYNAQPASMSAGLDLVDQVAQNSSKTKTRWACLGDMLELGPNEEQFHRELATKIIDLKIEHTLLYGTRMAFLADELEKQRYQGHYAHYSTHADLSAALTQGVKPGDAILIKGSRSMKMEEIWKVLEPYAKSQWSRPTRGKNPTAHT